MTHDLVAALHPLLTAEASAEAYAAGSEPGDLEQAVWLRLLERLETDGPPLDPEGWLRRAVRAEARRSRRTTRLERPYEGEPADDLRPGPEQHVLTAARYRALRDAVRRLPGRCPRLLEALLSPKDLTYREIAGELGISQGSLGPERSRCLGCLRRLLAPEVAACEARG
ncbi:sigma-70 family RNA polymerase sigma factor [Streptomyces sp. NPDC005890]|uniref:sigma-70 family RNA polymerase sigma factor n=1 Tax=Streptomyces sp. NPDC005890 TaxID=3154568 RepID=UPI0033D4A988